MLGFFVFVFGLMPFVLGFVAWHLLNRGGGSRSDGPPPPPPLDPTPSAPTRPRHARDRSPVPQPRSFRSRVRV